MTLFWFGIGAGVAGVSLIVWTMLRAAKADDHWLDVYGPLGPHFSETQKQRMRQPFNWADDGDWWIARLREEIRNLPTASTDADLR